MPGSWFATAGVVGTGVGGGIDVVALDDSWPECSAAVGSAAPDMQPLISVIAAPMVTTAVHLDLTRPTSHTIGTTTGTGLPGDGEHLEHRGLLRPARRGAAPRHEQL